MEDDTPSLEPESSGLTAWDVWAIVASSWRTLVVCSLFGLMGGGIAAMLAKPTYTSKSTVHVLANRGTYIDAGASVVGSPTMWTHSAYLKTQLQIMRSGDSRQQIVQRYRQLRGEQALPISPAKLNGAISLQLRRDTELVDISVTTGDPTLSADIANITAEVMRDEALESNIEAARDAKVWLAAQIEEWALRITEASATLVAYQRKGDVTEVGTDRTTLSAQLDSLKAAYGQAKTDRVLHETRVLGFEQMYRQGRYLDLAEQLAGPAMDPLAHEYAVAKVNQDLIAQDFLEKMPERQKADYTLQEAERRLKTEVRRVLDADQAMLTIKRNTERNLHIAITGGEEERLDVTSMQEDYQKLLMDLESAKKAYANMKERMSQVDLQSNTQLNHIRLIERAVPSKSSAAQDLETMLAIGVLGGLLLGGLLIAMREYLDDTIKSPFDVLTYVKVPVIGLVPRVTATEEVERSLFTHLNPKSPTAEATRALRTYIELNPSGQPPRRLMVTSAMSAEGKTSTAIRLAISYANLGRSVVIVDMDLRRPRLHKVFGLSREIGVTSNLINGVPVADVCNPTPIEGLSFVSSGPGTTHPGELLASKELVAFLDGLSAMFDIVVVDTPPSAILADARVVSRLVDAVVVVVRDKSTSRVPVREAVRGLLQVGANVLGVVLNDVDLTRAGPSYGYAYQYGYRYGYGYQYAYGYGYGNNQDDASESAAK